jgi:hypothetical protein
MGNRAISGLKTPKLSGKPVAISPGMTIKRLATSAALVGSFAIAAPAYAQHRGGGHASARGGVRVAPRIYGSVRVAPRVYGSRGFYRGPSYYRPSYFYRPYYSFRPRASLGFGLWLGYPVAYPSYYYGAPYGYTAPYPADPYAYENSAPAYPAPYGYQNQPYQQSSPSVGVQPGYQQPQASTGGVSFQITPEDAEVFVDGRQIGQAGDFGPSAPPLDLNPGHHRIEIRAPGYRTMSFDADVVAGQVIPVQGTLQRD